MTDLEKLIADLEEPRLGIHEDGTEELKTWEQLWDQCQAAAKALRAPRPEELRSLTDDEILNAAFTAADALDATRVSEMRPGGWHATTIFDGDTGLIRFGRLVESMLKRSEPQGER